MKITSISLPDDLAEWIDAECKNGSCGSTSDYLCGLARRQRDQVSARLASQKQLAIGIDSGISPRSYDEIIEEARRKAEALGFIHE